MLNTPAKNELFILETKINNLKHKMKLVSEKGHWATKDNSMIFTNVVYLIEEKDAYLYHLIDDNNQDIALERPITDYIVKEE